MSQKFLLLDLDNTLYPASAKMSTEIEQRMTRFVSERLGISEAEAKIKRHEGFLRYGTTLRWLMVEKNLGDPLPYLEAVHPQDSGNYLPARDPELRRLLEKIDFPMAILTNSPHFHANRVLEHLGIRDLFPQVFDLLFNEYEGKPFASAYQRVLQSLGRSAHDTILVDDQPSYLAGFAELGGSCILVDESGKLGQNTWPQIKTILELPKVLH